VREAREIYGLTKEEIREAEATPLQEALV